MNFKQMTIWDMCPNGGDASDDCKGCCYSEDYHLVDGECVLRTKDPSEAKFEAPREVCRK
jgi:hypothetical protein